MIKLVTSVLTASALIVSVAYAQQATTGDNQSNPAVNQDQGPVGENGQGRLVRPQLHRDSTGNSNMNDSAPAATTERAPRADRN